MTGKMDLTGSSQVYQDFKREKSALQKPRQDNFSNVVHHLCNVRDNLGMSGDVEYTSTQDFKVHNLNREKTALQKPRYEW